MAILDKKPVTLDGAELAPDNVAARIVDLYDPAAQKQYLEDIKGVERWISGRFGELGVDRDSRHSMDLSQNRYNRGPIGYGIQSVKLGIKRDGLPLRVDQTDPKDSTIGVVADGLLDFCGEEITWVDAGFQVDRGMKELIHPLSHYLAFESRKEGLVRGQPDPKFIRPGVLRRVLEVVGPDFATTILQVRMKNHIDGPAGHVQNLRLMPTRGTYACDFKLAK